MRKIAITLIILFQFNIGFCQVSDSIPLGDLDGTWYVKRSNFKKWLIAENQSPTFNYVLAIKNGQKGLLDVVAYKHKGKEKTILGFDKPMNKMNTQFRWRGKGLLSLFKSKWQILFWGQGIMIIHFERTLFTKEGYDVLYRHPTVPKSKDDLIDIKLKELQIPQLTVIN